MRLLIIGGTRFSGRALTGSALAAGHEVTLFHRQETDLFPEAEHVFGDRDLGVGALEGRTFDAVVDTCGYVPRAVRASAELLHDSGWYGFVSSLSAHPDDLPPGGTEDSPIHRPPWPATEEVTDDTYGPLKVACEEAVQEVFGDRACVIRPGYIVGPHDPTDRFTYWVRRAALGGQMLAPEPLDYGLQWVDARDLAAFVLHLAQERIGGVFGVVDRAPTSTIGGVIATAGAAAGSTAEVITAGEAWIAQQLGGTSGEIFPMWEPGMPGFHAFDPSRAFSAGLTCRDPDATIRDTLAWDRTREQVWPMRAGLHPERERQLLEELRSTRSGPRAT
jgi:2'-hydroxyisoflavone reductase